MRSCASRQNIVLDSSLDPLSRARSLKHFDGAIVMTHSHELDFSLCETLLQNTALKYIGLIGSESKSIDSENVFWSPVFIRRKSIDW